MLFSHPEKEPGVHVNPKVTEFQLSLAFDDDSLDDGCTDETQEAKPYEGNIRRMAGRRAMGTSRVSVAR